MTADTTASKVTKGTFTVKGAFNIAAVGLKLAAGSVLDVQGYIDGTAAITAETTLLGHDKDKNENIVAGECATFTITKPVTDPVSVHYVTGYKISVVKTSYMTTDEEPVEKYYQRAYIEGTLTYTPALATGTELDANGTIAVTKTVFIAAGTELKQAPGVIVTTAGAIVDGGNFIVVEGKYTSTTEDLPNVIGAVYAITAGEPEVTTNYAVDYLTGLAGIEDFKNKTVTLNGISALGKALYPVELDSDLTILDKQIVGSNGMLSIVIPEGVVLTVNKGGSFAGDAIAELAGKVVVMKDGTCDLAATLYEVYYENEAGDATYCGLETALSEAQVGDTITVTNNVDKTSFTVPAGVKVVIDTGKTLTVTKNITVSSEGALEIDGYLVFGTADTKNAKINVLGTMDVSAAQGANFINFVGTPEEVKSYGMQIISEGEFIYTTAIPEGIVQVGVTYKDGTKTVLTTITKALESEKDIAIPGTYSSSDNITLGTVKLTVTGTATIGSIDATGGSIDASEGKLTTTVSGLSGEADSVSIVLDGFQGIITDKAVADKYTAAITDLDAGSVKIASGTVVLKDATTTIEAKKTLEVADGATLEIADAGVEITNNGNLNIAGLLVVDKDAGLTIANAGDGKIAVAGDIEVAAAGNLSLAAATVSGNIEVFGDLVVTGAIALTGTIAIDDSEESVASATFSGDVTVGTSTISGGAAILGKKVTLNDDNYIAFFPGSEIGEDTVKDLKSTEFYLNGVLYFTAYGTALSHVNDIKNAAEPAVITKVIKVSGYSMTGMDVATNWKDAAGAAVAIGTKVGEIEAIYFGGEQLSCKIVVSLTKGTSVFIDGVSYASGTTIDDVAVGTHTVTATIDPGYKGTTQITFDGKTVTGSFEVTSDMVGPTAKYVLSVTGDITIDPGVSPTPTPEQKSEWGITTILLVVLIILIAVMVIVVILRMNRS